MAARYRKIQNTKYTKKYKLYTTNKNPMYCILFLFMLALLCFCVATEFSANKDFICMRTRTYVTVRCPSVRLSMGPQQQTRCCRLAAMGPASGRCRSGRREAG